MALGTLVDSSVLLDVFTDDQRWGRWSADHLASALDAGSVAIHPLIFAELSFGFNRIEDLDEALPDSIERADLPCEAAFVAGRASCSTAAVGGPAAHRCPTSTSLPTLRQVDGHCSRVTDLDIGT